MKMTLKEMCIRDRHKRVIPDVIEDLFMYSEIFAPSPEITSDKLIPFIPIINPITAKLKIFASVTDITK